VISGSGWTTKVSSDSFTAGGLLCNGSDTVRRQVVAVATGDSSEEGNAHVGGVTGNGNVSDPVGSLARR
jgi:hypothetical protein